MVDVKLKTPGGLRYEGKRYCMGDTLSITESFLGRHVTRFDVIEKPKTRRKSKSAESAEVVKHEDIA